VREEVFRGKIVTVAVLDGRWEVVEHPDAVAVLVQRGRSVLGVVQQRPAIGTASWELPAGLIEPGESPEAAARRELAEEAQLGGRFSMISRAYASPGFSDELIWLYEVHEVVAAEGTPDDGEVLHIEWRDALELWQAVARGEVATSAVSMLGLRHALARAGVAP
jgi:8-oxo-dGTP pyrophosphatase MutT (NUDIX family)